MRASAHLQIIGAAGEGRISSAARKDYAEAATAVIRGRELPARSRAVYLNGMASQAGVPALSVLCGFAKEGRFPVGLQLIGRDLDEALLYRVAYSYEQATEWHMRHPPL